MRVINADGSIPEMCGNGVRCVAIHVAAARGQTRGMVRVETDAGERVCVLGGDGMVTVDMGQPLLAEIGSRSADQLGIVVGAAILVLFKAVAVAGRGWGASAVEMRPPEPRRGCACLGWQGGQSGIAIPCQVLACR